MGPPAEELILFKSAANLTNLTCRTLSETSTCHKTYINSFIPNIIEHMLYATYISGTEVEKATLVQLLVYWGSEMSNACLNQEPGEDTDQGLVMVRKSYLQGVLRTGISK